MKKSFITLCCFWQYIAFLPTSVISFEKVQESLSSKNTLKICRPSWLIRMYHPYNIKKLVTNLSWSLPKTHKQKKHKNKKQEKNWCWFMPRAVLEKNISIKHTFLTCYLTASQQSLCYCWLLHFIVDQ